MPTNGENQSGDRKCFPFGVGGVKGPTLNNPKLVDIVDMADNTSKDRNRNLLQQGVSGFLSAIAKRNRLQNPKTPRNRWFRWKDR